MAAAVIPIQSSSVPPSSPESPSSTPETKLDIVAKNFYHRVRARETRSAYILEVSREGEFFESGSFAVPDEPLCRDLLRAVRTIYI